MQHVGSPSATASGAHSLGTPPCAAAAPPSTRSHSQQHPAGSQGEGFACGIGGDELLEDEPAAEKTSAQAGVPASRQEVMEKGTCQNSERSFIQEIASLADGDNSVEAPRGGFASALVQEARVMPKSA